MQFSIYMTESSRIEELNLSKLALGAIEIAKAINSLHDNTVDYYACADSEANQSMALLSEDIKLATLQMTPVTLQYWNSHLKRVYKLLQKNCLITEHASSKAKENLANAMKLMANIKDFDSYHYADSEINVLFQGDAIAVKSTFVNDLRNLYSFEDVLG